MRFQSARRARTISKLIEGVKMKIKRLLIVAITATLLPQLSIAGSLENLERREL